MYRELSMNTDQKILRLKRLWKKNNSMNVVVYQSRYHAYRSFQWIENNNASITECKTSRCLWSVHRFSNVWQFEKLPRN